MFIENAHPVIGGYTEIYRTLRKLIIQLNMFKIF